MNPDLDRLQPYPFEKLASLIAGVEPAPALERIALSIGEPKHPTPSVITDAAIAHLHGLAVYPSTRGLPELRAAISRWLRRRFHLPDGDIDPERQVLPVNGTREALFAFAQAVVDPVSEALVTMPNPFYQIYEGATLLAGAQPYYLSCLEENRYIPDFDSVDADTWQRCQLLYLCSPGNPTGAVIDLATLQRLIEMAEEYDFVIAADECYSEIYFDEAAPPVGLLQAAAAMNHRDYRRCVVFHSLSKRSNAPGMRSGFVAGDAQIIDRFLRYRTYHGCAMPLHHQHASIAAWDDEEHVIANRRSYREKFTAVLQILDGHLPVTCPDAGFYLWPSTPIEDTEFARGLLAGENLVVLPGRYLSREIQGVDPGARRLRLALVAPLEECVEAARRIRRYLESL
ncbi:MAG: succinyldiaminopimelate transaminase [Chromatiaceae bacterium]|jgi:N-succinyldiaminopimelate aminotransferase|nr:succinyldiaminopimelate transaminase [Chromatiaceae bacterium]